MEQLIDIEKATALALLDRGIKFRIPAPLILMLFRKKTISITVKRLYLGTLIYLSALEEIAPLEAVKVTAAHKTTIKNMGSKPKSLPIKAIVENHRAVCDSIAACLLNSRFKIVLFSKLLGRHLRRSCTPDQIQELAMWLFVYGRPEAFTNTTRYLRTMRVTKPRLMGLEERS